MTLQLDRKALVALCVVALALALPAVAMASDAGITRLDNVVDQIEKFVTSKFVVMAAAVAFIGGLISFVAGGEWNVAMQAAFRFAFVASIIVGLTSVITFFGVAGAALPL